MFLTKILYSGLLTKKVTLAASSSQPDQYGVSAISNSPPFCFNIPQDTSIVLWGRDAR